MKNVIDYRSVSLTSIVEDINKFKKPGAAYTNLINAYLHIAVWHSIKDGQTSPGIALLAAVMPQLKESVSLYLTKYGLFTWTKKDGLKYNATAGTQLIKKAKEEGFTGDDGIKAFRKMVADNTFNELPSLDDAFPKKEKQYRDMILLDAFKHLIQRAQEVQSNGKAVQGDEEAKALLDMMQTYVASFAK